MSSLSFLNEALAKYGLPYGQTARWKIRDDLLELQKVQRDEGERGVKMLEFSRCFMQQ